MLFGIRPKTVRGEAKVASNILELEIAPRARCYRHR